MSPDRKQVLLKTRTVGAFLTALRGSETLQKVAERLRAWGGPTRRGSIANYEQERRSIGAGVQLAYCRAYALDDDLRLHLQKLAGEAAGCPPTTEQAA